MKKIGIITLYNNTNNYGGALQAFALSYYLRTIGEECKQISYMQNAITLMNAREKRNRLRKILQPKEVYEYICRKVKREIYIYLTKGRRKYFEIFLNDIPHTEVFDRRNIVETNKYFDIFIAGSDQIWNFDWYDPSFFLDFVEKGKLKFSYAASFGRQIFSQEQEDIIKSKLSTFKYISLREKGNVNNVSRILNRDVSFVVDPTLLLTRKQWDDVLPGKKYEQGYVFCYFLGDDIEIRKTAIEFSKKTNMKIITIPHPDSLLISDLLFKAEKKYNASPLDFVELIKNASFVFTDSFHCCAFSCLYEKEIFAFPRKGKKGMENRIKSLFELFDISERFFENKVKFDNFILLNKKIKYDATKYYEVREFSEKYLDMCIELGRE